VGPKKIKFGMDEREGENFKLNRRGGGVNEGKIERD
jgi:hypothetical protein